jgi:hypothetical protein
VVAARLKLVWFVPPLALDTTREAVFAAGAGRIGAYTRCSWSTLGTGTFYGTADTSPAIGAAGRDERVVEYRVETVLPADKLDAVLAALRRAHPYEEPAIDVYPLLDA